MSIVLELKTYYKDLLILQYINKPRARAVIDTLAEIAVMNDLPNQVKDGFNLADGVGKQLDTIGKYLGVTRRSYGNFDAEDEEFRVVMRLAILKNSAQSDLFSIQKLVFGFFPDRQILIFDYLGMRVGYYIDAAAMSEEVARLVVVLGLLPRPMGVALSATIYRRDIDKLYGLRSYTIDTANIKGFNKYADYDEDAPWVSYRDAI